MFTGLVQAVGTVRSNRPTAPGARLEIEPTGPIGAWGHSPAPGDSVSVAGCCLTLAAPSAPSASQPAGAFAFDIVRETLAKTTLGGLASGDHVNLESALTLGSPLGGHLVQGHVDGVGTVEDTREWPDWRVRIRPPAPLMEYLVPKGSIAVDGVSLTVAAVDPAAGWFEVALIPTTLERTTLAALRPGKACNLEMDCIAKTIVHWTRHYAARPAGPAHPL